MAYAIQTAFGAGELSPELQERTTLEKYKTGLKTLRNAVVTKKGTIVSRSGTQFIKSTKRNSTLIDQVVTADHTTDTLSTPLPHGLVTGQTVQFTTTGTLPAPLVVLYDFAVFVTSPTQFKVSGSLDLALVEITIFLSDNGTGVHTTNIIDKAPKKAILYHAEYSNYIVEFGDLYARIHNIATGTFDDEGGYHPYRESDLPFVQLEYGNEEFVYITKEGTYTKRMYLKTLIPGDPSYSFRFTDYGVMIEFPSTLPFGQSSNIVATGTPAGYDVEYGYTYFIDGQESGMLPIFINAKLPIAVGQFNTVTVELTIFDYQKNSNKKVNIYRRPKQGQAYGFIGVADTYADTASPPHTDRLFTFIDYGQSSDFTHLPPTNQSDFEADTKAFVFRQVKARAIGLYQQRVVLGGTLSKNSEASFVSRPGYPLNFKRDYPLNAESALAIKAGSIGTPKVLRYADIGGLVAFTTQGIYSTPNGPLVPETAYMILKANYVLDSIVSPLKLPGVVIFPELSTNSIIAINYSDDQASFVGSDILIYSSHLLEGKRVVSWAYQDGIVPLVWCVLDDGTLTLLTWQNEQLVRAWSRGDTDGLFESVTAYKNSDGTKGVYFIVNRGGSRSIEKVSNRWVTDIKDYIGMDSAVTYKSPLNSSFTLTPVSVGDWEGNLKLVANSNVFANTADNGAIGSIFRYFHPTEKYAVDLEVVAYTSQTQVTVIALSEFPQLDNKFNVLYRTATVITGLNHLEGKNVSVLLDGFVQASPYNLVDEKETYTVTGGQITLSTRGAIVQVGLPYVVDVETLDVETVEQKPTWLESILCNKIMIKYFRSRMAWVGQYFGPDDTNEGMENQEKEYQALGDVNVAPKALQPYTQRTEVTVEGDWQGQGRVAIRQVDPLPLEISSIIPDIQVEYRS